MANRSVKTFNSNTSEEVSEPVKFKLNDEEFVGKAKVSGLALMKLVAASNKGGAEAIGAILEFLTKALPKDEYARFEEYVEENDIDSETVNEVISYLIESHSARPTP